MNSLNSCEVVGSKYDIYVFRVPFLLVGNFEAKLKIGSRKGTSIIGSNQSTLQHD